MHLAAQRIAPRRVELSGRDAAAQRAIGPEVRVRHPEGREDARLEELVELLAGDRLDDEAEREGDAQGDQEPEPRVVLERLPPEVAEQRGVRRPQETGDRVVHDEAPPRERGDVPGGERHGDPSSRDEPGDENDVRAALVEHPFGPFETLARLFTREPALDGVLSDQRAEAVGDVVPDHRPECGEHDDEGEVQVARRGEVARDDDDGLARDDGEEGVHQGDPEDQRVAPPGPGHPVRDLVEVEPARHGRHPRRAPVSDTRSLASQRAAPTGHVLLPTAQRRAP